MNLRVAKVILVALCSMFLLVTGCNSQDKEDEAQGDKQRGQYVYGMVVKSPGVPFIQAFMQGAEEQAEEMGDNVVIKNGQGDSIEIMNRMDNFINQDVDGFIQAGAVDLKAIVPGVKRLNEADIPVMALDTSPEGGDVEMFISFDIEDASKKAAEAFIDGIKERNNGEVPEGKVIEITGSLKDMFAQSCTKGFESVVKDYPQLDVVQGEGKWNNNDAHEKTSDLLTRHGEDVLGIYVHTPDIMGQGVVSAIEAEGKNPEDFGICGICMGPVGKELIKEGKIRAIVSQPAYSSGKLAVEYLHKINEGEEIPKIGETVEEEGAIWSPAEVVENPWADGAFMKLNAPLVPMEVGPDDPRLWENKYENWD